MSVREFLEDQMRTTAHGAPPDYTGVGSPEGRPPTFLVHSGLNFVGRARKVNRTWLERLAKIWQIGSRSLYVLCSNYSIQSATQTSHAHLRPWVLSSQSAKRFSLEMGKWKPWMIHQNREKESTMMKMIRNILQQLSDYHFFLEQPVLQRRFVSDLRIVRPLAFPSDPKV
jgi:hypothetical protein